MKILLGNFAGALSNIGKFLTWCLIKKENDKIFFIYWNKGQFNNHPQVWPIQEFPKEHYKNIFYKYFAFPENAEYSDYLTPDAFFLNYPCFLNEKEKEMFPIENYPSVLHKYKGFAFDKDVFYDPNFSEIRQIFHTVWKKNLIPTPYFQEFMKSDIDYIQSFKDKGKILCVMIRFPNHFSGGYNSNAAFDEIKEISNSFDYILPITQQEPFYTMFLELFPQKCIPLDRRRLPLNVDWADVPYSDEEFEDEFRIAIKDVYLASMCHTIMGGSSNLFSSALFLNPTCEFRILNVLKNRGSS